MMEGAVEVVHPRVGKPFEQKAAPRTSATPASTFPILEFLFFHKAIRAELGRLYNDALAVEKGGEREFQALHKRYEFLRLVYLQHSNLEDEAQGGALQRYYTAVPTPLNSHPAFCGDYPGAFPLPLQPAPVEEIPQP